RGVAVVHADAGGIPGPRRAAVRHAGLRLRRRPRILQGLSAARPRRGRRAGAVHPESPGGAGGGAGSAGERVGTGSGVVAARSSGWRGNSFWGWGGTRRG